MISSASPFVSSSFPRHFTSLANTISRNGPNGVITAVTNNNDNHVFLILEAEAEAIDESRVFRLLVFHSLNGQSAHQ